MLVYRTSRKKEHGQRRPRTSVVSSSDPIRIFMYAHMPDQGGFDKSDIS